MKMKVKILMCMMLVCGFTALLQAREIDYDLQIDKTNNTWAHTRPWHMYFDHQKKYDPKTKYSSKISDGFFRTLKDSDIQYYKDKKTKNYYVAFFWEYKWVFLGPVYGVKIWELSYKDGKYSDSWVCCLSEGVGWGASSCYSNFWFSVQEDEWGKKYFDLILKCDDLRKNDRYYRDNQGVWRHHRIPNGVASTIGTTNL